jgi:hypothetical protein
MLLFHFKASFNDKKIILLVTVKNPPNVLFNYHSNIINSKTKHNIKQNINIQISNSASGHLSTKSPSEKNLQDLYAEIFNLNFHSLVNLNNYLDQNKKIDDLKYWLKKENLSTSDYFRNKNFGIYKKNLADSNQQRYFIITPIDLKDTNFLVDYIEFTKTLTLADFISNLKIILSNILKDYETAFEAAKKINLEYPVGMNNSSIDTISTDLVYKGSKILAEEIFNLEKVLKSLSSNQFNYNVIYDAEKNKLESHSSSRFPLWLNNLGGLVFGFFLSLMIILFRYILKKNI